MATPRTDEFVKRQPPIKVADFATAHQIRELMIAWANFARELEEELNRSIPQEWRQ